MSMPASSSQQFLQDIRAEFERIEFSEPMELQRLRTGALENQAGSYGQYFGTWDIAHGMLRDFAFYSLYPILRVAKAEPAACHALLFDELFEPYTNYLAFSGFPLLESFGLRLRALAKEAVPGETVECLAAYFMYANRLYAWAYHYFPWRLGEQFRYTEHAEPDTLSAPDADALKIEGREIKLSWTPLDISVRAILADNLNPELCDDLIRALPFKVLQQHPVVSGKSMFAWGAPIASTAPIRVREEIRFAPTGRLRFSQRTGQKFIIQYGRTNETIFAPVLGGVVEEDIHHLRTVGNAVWESTYKTKKPIQLRVECL